MLGGYYSQEKKSFWLIQTLMATSVLLGLVWLLGIIAGLNHLNDADYLTQFGFSVLIDFFSQPLSVWLAVLSISGLLGAATLFLSYQVGVKSIIRYQVYLLHQIFKTINQSESVDWLNMVKDDPRKKTHRIIKTSVQMTGLVIRRLVRMLIPLVTFIFAFVALVKLDGPLLLNLIPLALLYIFFLYFINRYAARNQVRLTGVAEVANRQIGGIADDLLSQQKQFGKAVINEVDQSEYRLFSELRYKRRLAEIHVVWANSLFLILGSAVIILSYGSYVNSSSIDWMHLIMFLIALRYAASGLQEMASSTVAFSRFLPETELVYGLLQARPRNIETLNLKGLVFYYTSNSGIEVLLPHLLKLEYGANKCIQLDEIVTRESLSQDVAADSVWIYSSKPIKFFQAVKQHKKLLSYIFVSTNGKTKQYDSFHEFKSEFNPQQHVKIKQSDDSSYDDEMF